MPDLDMSPYAAFVWPAWGISALVLAALAARTLAGARRWKREMQRLEAEGAPQTSEGADSRPQAARSAVGPQE